MEDSLLSASEHPDVLPNTALLPVGMIAELSKYTPVEPSVTTTFVDCAIVELFVHLIPKLPKPLTVLIRSVATFDEPDVPANVITACWLRMGISPIR